MFGESYIKEMRELSLVGNNVWRTSDNSEDLCDHVTDQLKTSHHLITYVRYVLENYKEEDFLFSKLTDCRATSLQAFNITNHYLEENEIHVG
jgi:hypothetical protein